MRYHCYECGKSVTSELPDDAVIRAVLICPECIEAGKIIFPEKDDDEPTGQN
jgi:DNA-directed RNA polymerase subunit RPC12/RpoP